MVILKEDLKRIPLLFLGFALLSFGLMLTKRASLGMDSWGVFHQGLAINLDLSFGVITQLLGLVILLFSVWLLKTKIGLGTILNVIIIGFMIDTSDIIFSYIPSTNMEKTILLVIGLVAMTFGRSLYISTNLGAGPRDGLFVGLSRITKIDIKYIKPSIEFSVLFLGFLLGGPIGLGTVFIVITSGYLVEYFFKVLHYDPKTEKQRNFSDYFPQIKKGTT